MSRLGTFLSDTSAGSTQSATTENIKTAEETTSRTALVQQTVFFSHHVKRRMCHCRSRGKTWKKQNSSGLRHDTITNRHHVENPRTRPTERSASGGPMTLHPRQRLSKRNAWPELPARIYNSIYVKLSLLQTLIPVFASVRSATIFSALFIRTRGSLHTLLICRHHNVDKV